MSVTININGELVLDQTPGVQVEDDDVAVSVVAGDLVGGLDQNFLDFLNTLTLSAGQLAFADNVEGASDPDLVTVTADAGETIGKLFFSDVNGNDFDGDPVPGVTTVDGQALFFFSEQNGKVVLVKTALGEVAAAFYIESFDATNTAAKVESITFMPLFHADTENHDDRIDFSDVLRVSAVITQNIGDDINVDDDGPSIVTSGNEPNLTTDDTEIIDSATDSFAISFTPDFGTDGAGAIGYDLNAVAGPSGLIATIADEAIILSKDLDGNIEGRTELGGELAFEISVDQLGNVTLTQHLAVRHDPEAGPNQSTTLAAGLVSLTATITDFEGDHDEATIDIGDNFFFLDDAPSIDTIGELPVATVDETDLLGNATADFSGNFTHLAGNDGLASVGITYELAIGVAATGLLDVATNQAVTAAIVGGVIEARNTNGDLVFTISVDGDGNVTLDQSRAVTHADPLDPNDTVQFSGGAVVTLTATITDGDADTDSAVLDITDSFVFTDDGPEITVQSSATAENPAELGNQVGAFVTGAIGWNVGNDNNNYDDGDSDFVAAPTLTGTVGEAPTQSAIFDAVVTAGPEDADSAEFDFSFSFDKDPLTAGIQEGTASGTLTFDKDADTFTVTLDDEVEGFSFSVLHTSELLAKAPPGNTGHPEIVVSKLADDFFVQFTGNNTPFSFTNNGEGSSGDTLFTQGAHDMIASDAETWVSATQSTNGVAGDTIQKGEALTLRFFEDDILGTVDPNAPEGGTEFPVADRTTAQGVAIKFDGIGNSEDLMAVLDLIDDQGTADTGDDVSITRAIRIDNADFYKGNTVPSPYNTEFSLDNNDALVIIEANDYNAAGEEYEIQGIQIVQSANNLNTSSQAINLNKVTDNLLTPEIEGGSNATGGFQTWDAQDNDVLKITDIGFIQTTSGSQDADLDFSFTINDGDGDMTLEQHIHLLISNDFIL